ncbi:MAG: RES family NAD+ phosphorylase [Ginsengibacter sp.]
MEIFRVAQERFADDLSGNGSRLYGGRWNSEGVFALYASGTRSMALLETLAHTPAKMLNANVYQLITLSVPDNIVPIQILSSSLPGNWDTRDARPITKRLGDKFVNDKINLIIAVPCVLLPEEINYVINPLHKDMRKVKIVYKRRIYFDNRVRSHL